MTEKTKKPKHPTGIYTNGKNEYTLREGKLFDANGKKVSSKEVRKAGLLKRKDGDEKKSTPSGFPTPAEPLKK